jgi:hypothetical protein
MRPTRELPPGYARAGGMDLARQRLLAVVLTLIAFLLFGVLIALLGAVVSSLRPTATRGDTGVDLVAASALVIIVLLVHEAIHGVFFWVVTGERPRYGIRALYAYAAAPDWYIPRDRFLLVGVAPLGLVSLVGAALLLVAQGYLLSLVALGVALNAAGSIGDLAIVALVLRQPADTLVRDAGPAVTFFRPGQPAGDAL